MNNFTEQKLKELKHCILNDCGEVVDIYKGTLCGGNLKPVADFFVQYTNDLIEEIEKEFVGGFKKKRCIPCEMDESEIKELLKTFLLRNNENNV